MDRRVTRRTVAKLAYAAPIVAASMRLSARPVGAISPGPCGPGVCFIEPSQPCADDSALACSATGEVVCADFGTAHPPTFPCEGAFPTCEDDRDCADGEFCGAPACCSDTGETICYRRGGL